MDRGTGLRGLILLQGRSLSSCRDALIRPCPALHLRNRPGGLLPVLKYLLISHGALGRVREDACDKSLFGPARKRSRSSRWGHVPLQCEPTPAGVPLKVGSCPAPRCPRLEVAAQ